MIGSGLKKFAEEKGLRVAKGVAYGSLQGFAATLSEGSGYKQVVFVTKFTDIVQRDLLLDAIGKVDIQRTYNVQSFNVSPSTIQIVFTDTLGTMKKLQAFLEWLLPLLRQYGATGANTCAECGCELTGCRWVLIDGIAYPMHSTCVDKVKRDVAADEETRKQESQGSYISGALGAFAGAALGAVVWALLLMMEFFASLAGLLIGWLAEKGYNLLKGKQNRGKVVFLILAVIFGVAVGTLGGYVLTFARWIAEGQGFGLTYADIPLLMEIVLTDPEGQREVIGNILLGLLFAGLGVFALLRKAGKEVSGTKVIDLE